MTLTVSSVILRLISAKVISSLLMQLIKLLSLYILFKLIKSHRNLNLRRFLLLPTHDLLPPSCSSSSSLISQFSFSSSNAIQPFVDLDILAVFFQVFLFFTSELSVLHSHCSQICFYLLQSTPSWSPISSHTSKSIIKLLFLIVFQSLSNIHPFCTLKQFILLDFIETSCVFLSK